MAAGFRVWNSGWRSGEREPRSKTPCGRCLRAAGTGADPVRRTRCAEDDRGRPRGVLSSIDRLAHAHIVAAAIATTVTDLTETIGTRAYQVAVSGGCDDHVQDVVAARCAI